MKRKKLISNDQAVQSPVQHSKPCSDCPARRDSLKGWLGGSTAEEYVQLMHSDCRVDCHVISNQQCAGVAIYRANVVKRVDPPNLKLPKDTKTVFANWDEFLKHHAERARIFAIMEKS